MKLNETINDIFTEDGIFTAIQKTGKLQWLSGDMAKELDIEYYLQHSGMKTITGLFENLITLKPESYLNILASLVVNKYGLNWTKIFDAFNAEYKPLENYNMIEKVNVGSELVTSKDGTVTHSGTVKTATDISTDVSNTDLISGFNSEGFVNDSSTDSVQRVTGDKEANTNESSNSGTSKNVETVLGDSQKNFTETKRSGNIGVTTSQKMLTEEIELRKYNLVNRIMKDVDSLLTLGIYE